ncbi:Helix-turn-helix domain [Mycobacteroides abscessus subsp. abscessus]|nr:helix-turn-helix domain-containing protein [Mycobacteroides abscessus subsp. abscessus]SHQ37566.1 Helix-turn-helix domain [Mycobacteroides abscessus subsp. abscessus]SHY83436.1 Helix-turn-helix domain [Mycobacteroides abscessus subsp. abscessus]SHY96851.1 Helix-turn-helix domain [Mycobacteroides abscessus subsp. abscessus]SIF15202.1 Helix-turn-helix domain [Mycobacteroides abscessus subsp. abscessus]
MKDLPDFGDYLDEHGNLRVPPRYARYLENRAEITSAVRDRVKMSDPAGWLFLQALHISASLAASGNKSPAPQPGQASLLTTAEAAVEIGKSARCVRQWCKTGHLQAQRQGRDWMIRRVDLEALKASM